VPETNGTHIGQCQDSVSVSRAPLGSNSVGFAGMPMATGANAKTGSLR